MRAALVGSVGVFVTLYNVWFSGRSKYEFRRRYARRHIWTGVGLIVLAGWMVATGAAG